jgi:NAD(P)-dependent dehydrogenase (short-subunit alcohol dehydrogenase family)
MDLGLDNRHALLTGASRGLGRAIAAALAAEGATVAAVARNLERLKELAATAAVARGTITAHACDLADGAALDTQRSAMLMAYTRHMTIATYQRSNREETRGCAVAITVVLNAAASVVT